ncbi:porphobilinogen synthase, partial [Neisseria gonorrhoeae]
SKNRIPTFVGMTGLEFQNLF